MILPKKILFSLLAIVVIVPVIFALLNSQTTNIVPGIKKTLNIVVIDICSARADHLSYNGYSRKTTPNIDEFSKEAVVFDKAWTQANWCLPNIATMLTGTRPEVNKKFVLGSVGNLSPSVRTLSEILGKAGYDTVGFAGMNFLTNEYGLNKGFTSFTNIFDGSKGVTMSFEENLPKVKEFLASHKNSKNPFFLYMTVDDLHSPYHTDDQNLFDPGYKGIFSSIGNSGMLMGDTKMSMSTMPAYILGGNFFQRLYNGESIQKITGQQLNVMDIGTRKQVEALMKDVDIMKKDPKELYHFVARYDASLNRVDRLVGEVLSQLKEDYRDNTVVIITAHQGEYFGEKGLLGHSEGLNESILNVPLLIYYPGANKGVKDNLVERIDIPTTILDIVGILPDYKNQFVGTSLLPLIKGENVTWKDFIFASTRSVSSVAEPFTIDERAVRNSQYKLIWSANKPQQYELYDLKADSGETNNIIASNQQVFKELKTQLDAYVNKFTEK